MFFQDERRIGKIPFKKKFMEVFIRVREHNPAHVHIKFEGKEGSFKISDGEWMVGRGFTEKEKLKIKEWIRDNRMLVKNEWNRSNALLRMDVALVKGSTLVFRRALRQWSDCLIREVKDGIEASRRNERLECHAYRVADAARIKRRERILDRDINRWLIIIRRELQESMIEDLMSKVNKMSRMLRSVKP